MKNPANTEHIKIIVRSDERPDDSQGNAWMSVHLPSDAVSNGTAVVICPGGGYQDLADDYEGTDCAAWMNSMGVAAFVLRYRLAPRFRHPCQLQDAQWAIRYVRANAAAYGINPLRIGIWGFSAGGHLASAAATHYDSGNPAADDPIGRVSCRPDFLILAYPVISLIETYTHVGSRENLLGPEADPGLVDFLSGERQVTSNTPPTFIFHTDSDEGVSSENSVRFYLALRKAGVPAEMHIYAQGPHGVGMAATDPLLSNWTLQLRNWLSARNLIAAD